MALSYKDFAPSGAGARLRRTDVRTPNPYPPTFRSKRRRPGPRIWRRRGASFVRGYSPIVPGPSDWLAALANEAEPMDGTWMRCARAVVESRPLGRLAGTGIANRFNVLDRWHRARLRPALNAKIADDGATSGVDAKRLRERRHQPSLRLFLWESSGAHSRPSPGRASGRAGQLGL